MNISLSGRFLLSRTLIVSGLMLMLVIPALAGAQSIQQENITLKEFMITPSEITVTQGQPVQFTVTNNGTIEHNFTVEMPSQKIEQELFDTNLKPGETRTAEYTFSVAGDWEMYCPVDSHEDHGMKGDLEVLSSTPGGMPETGTANYLSQYIIILSGTILLGVGLLVRRRTDRARQV